MKLHGSMEIKGQDLYVGGVSLEALAETYGTPLYVFDEADLVSRARIFLDNFRSDRFATQVYYASKSFSNLYVLGLIAKLGLSVDVVSGGEFYTAIQAGLDPAKLNFHGNNKLESELLLALDEAVGHITIDNWAEYDLLSKLARERQQKVKVLVRVNPGIEAKTHKYIQTSKEDSKFGLSTADPACLQLLKTLADDPWLELEGLHSHIGSQVLDPGFFFAGAEALMAYLRQIKDQAGLSLTELNLGGGFGVYYTAEDKPFDLAGFLKDYVKRVEDLDEHYAIGLKKLSIEPGRSLINDSGSILYRVGGIKETRQGKPFIFVDGGMTDNIRPALYQAKYEVALANKMNQPVAMEYRVAGKCCETGDILVESAPLPKADRGDLLVIPAAGAYTYAMSSNYNRLPKGAVVFVKEGKARLAVRREDYQDLLRNDLAYPGQ